MTEKETYTNFKTLLVNILYQNGYTNGKDYKIRYFKSSPYRANRGEKNVQECWLTVRNAPTNVAVAEDDFDDIESLTNYVCGLVDSKWSSKKKAKQATTFHVGDLICYKGVEESVFKIVGTKGNNYLVVEIGDRTKTENKIPFADNDKLQRAVSPLLISEAKLVKNNKEVKVGDEFIKPKEWELPNAWLSDNIKDKYDLFYVSYVHPDGTICLYDEQSGKTERYTQSEFYQLGLQFYKHYSKDNGISGTSENLIQDFQENIWKNGFNSVTLRQLDNLIKDIQDGRIETDTDRRLRQSSIRFARINDGRMVGENYQPRSESIPLIAAQICAGSCGRINKSASGYFIEGLIEKWAKHANCWIDDIEKYALSKSWERAKELDGTESMLYTTPYNTIVKVWGMNNYYFNPQLAVEKITLHNFLFGSDTYLNVIGFTKINYFLYFILEQPIIHFTKESFNSIAIQDYLQKKYPNCNVDKFKGQFIVHLPDIYIWDLHGRNVVRTSKNRDFVVIDCNIKFKNNDNIKDLNSDFSGTSTPPKITDKGDDFSYFDYPKDIIDKFYTYIRISNLDKYIPAFSNYFFDDDGHLCFPTRRTQDIIDCVDIDRCLKGYEDLKHEWIAKAEDNINGFIWQFFINDTEFSPRGSYNYKILNRDLVELLLGYANKFEETSELYPDKLGVENLQDYNKTKEILTKRLAELDKQEKKPKQTKKPPTIPTIQPERLLKFDRNRLYMSCVHCVRGYKFYSDAHFLLKLKSDYPKSYEGKNVMPKHFFKKFEEFIINPEKVLFYDEGAYPVADAVIYSTLSKIKYSVPIDIQSLYQYLCDLIDYYEKQTGEEVKDFNRHLVPIFYNGQHAFTMDIVRLKQILSAAKLINADTIKWVDYSYAVVLQNSKSDNGEILLIMPHYRDETPTITYGKCLIDDDWDIWYKPYDLANTRKANILITEAKLCKIKSKK